MSVEDRGPELLAIIWIFTILSSIVVGIKIFTRIRVLNALGWDDFFIFLSSVLIIICTSIFSYDVHLGMGKHATDIQPEQLSQAVKVNYIGNPFGIMAYSLPNISIAILINRLLAPNRFRSYGLLALAISQCCIAAVSCVLLFAQATPTAYLWNPTLPGKLNYSSSVLTGYSYFVGSYTAVVDIVLGVVPVIAFWKLQLKMRMKIGLSFLMACTLFAAICAIIKTTKLNELADLADFTYGTVDLIIWAIVEANIIIIAACMPTMRPFFQHALLKHDQVSEGRGMFKNGFRVLYRGFGSSGNSMDGLHRNNTEDTSQRSYSESKKSYTSDHGYSKRSMSEVPQVEPTLPPAVARKSTDNRNAILRTTEFVTSSDDGDMV